MNKNKMIGYIILGIVAVGFYVAIMRHNSNENKKIFNNPEYSIGVVTYFSNAKGAIGVPNAVTAPAKPAEIKYKYEVNGDGIENGYVDGEFKVPFSGPIAGEKYLVIYLKTNPQKSRMLFDYPINDSSDFVRYCEILKKNPLQLNWMDNAIIHPDK